jgi:hypothetical protein
MLLRTRATFLKTRVAYRGAAKTYRDHEEINTGTHCLECNYFNKLPRVNGKISHVSKKLTRAATQHKRVNDIYVEGEITTAIGPRGKFCYKQSY